jgi:2-polyprenyl-3-methyl-5-hydroxy-6-metoxy-1,4-benzoquinol methylase
MNLAIAKRRPGTRKPHPRRFDETSRARLGAAAAVLKDCLASVFQADFIRNPDRPRFMTANCPACTSTEAERYPYDEHLRRITVTSVRHQVGSVLFALRLRSAWLRNRLLFGPTRNVLRCPRSGHGRYEREFKPGELDDYYHRRYFLADGLPRERWDDRTFVTNHAKTRGQWAFVQPHLERLPALQMLDIGAAASRISRMARLHFGDRAQCSVVEPGDGWAEYYQHHRIRIAGRFFPCADSESYDYIHTSHWLEHVEKLEPVIQAMRARLKPGGLCFIEVPNCDANYFAHDFPDQPHIHFFTAKSLVLCMAAQGFQAVDVRECAMANPDYIRYRRHSEAMSQEELHAAEETEASIENVPGGNLLRGLFRIAS